MAHKHSVYDTDAHFSINPITKAIKNESSKKTTLIQFDKNSEIFGFSLDRYVEGHDMTLCDTVEIHFDNIDSATGEINRGVYEVKDLQISKDDPSKVVFSWKVDDTATQKAGPLEFSITFECTETGETVYRWGTLENKDVSVSKTKNNGKAVTEAFPDVLTQWKNDLFSASEDGVVNITEAETNALAAIEAAGEAKKQAVLDSIPDEYEALQTGVDTLFNSVASGIRGNISGAVVMADDVSPVEHHPVVRVHGKNLFHSIIDKTGVLSGISHAISKNTSTVILSGVATQENALQLPDSFSLRKGTYTVSVIGLNESDRIYLRNQTKGEVIINHIKPSTPRTFTLSEDADIRTYLVFKENSTYDNTSVHIQIEQGDTATDYEPYIDPSTVKVKRYGKNLIPPHEIFAHAGYTVATNSDGSVKVTGASTANGAIYLNLSSVTESHLILHKGTKYSFKWSASNGRKGYMKLVGVDGENKWITISEGETILDGDVYAKVAQFYVQIGASSATDPNAVGDTSLCGTYYFQLEVGELSTDFEAYQTPDDYIPAADGSVSGMTSLSPCMTVLTDTDGAIVECEYNIDTKTYIDNKIKELMEGVE